MTKDDCLSDGDDAVDVRDGLVLGVLVLTLHEILFNVVQDLFFFLQADRDRRWNNELGKVHYFLLVSCAEQHHLAPLAEILVQSDALVLVTLLCDHDVGFVEYEDLDFRQVEGAELERPVEDLSRRSDDDVIDQLSAAFNFFSSDSIADADIRAELCHSSGDLTSLDGELVCWAQAQHLRIFLVSIDTSQHRESERCSFSCAALRLSDHILRWICDECRESCLLNLRRCVVAHCINSLKQFRFSESKIGKMLLLLLKITAKILQVEGVERLD